VNSKQRVEEKTVMNTKARILGSAVCMALVVTIVAPVVEQYVKKIVEQIKAATLEGGRAKPSN
jgi:hypothetical protein